MGAAMRCVTSEPAPPLSMMGTKPAIVDIGVITGLTRFEVADKTAPLLNIVSICDVFLA
tara:strand:- start:937 stop:1113 length:177 start_codon:yes stop_codon:yes gene_type:complete